MVIEDNENFPVLEMLIAIGEDEYLIRRPLEYPIEVSLAEASPTSAEVQSLVEVEEHALRTPLSVKFAVGFSAVTGAVISTVPLFLVPTVDEGNIDSLSVMDRVQENADYMIALGVFATLSLAALSFASIRSDTKANKRVERRIAGLRTYLTQVREEDGEG